MTGRKERVTRRPTGKPPWPIVLLAGVEKAGKSYAAALASGSDLIGRALWISVGEDDPDEYGKVPGADFEIVPHDGTYRDLLDAVLWAVEQPRVDGKPTLIIVDSMGRAWDLLSDMAQSEANKRRGGNGEARIASDLWNLAGQRWSHILDALRSHDGPVIVTARLERQTVFTEDGNPTKDKQNKVKAQKGLPFDVGVVVEMRARGEVYVTGARSLEQMPATDQSLPSFTVDELWRRMGLAEEDATAPRQHTTLDADPARPEVDAARAELRAFCEAHGLDARAVASAYTNRHNGVSPRDEVDASALHAFLRELQEAADRRAQADTPAADEAATTERTTA